MTLFGRNGSNYNSIINVGNALEYKARSKNFHMANYISISLNNMP